MSLITWLKNFPVRISKAKLFTRYRGSKDDWIDQEINFTLEELGYKFSKFMPSYINAESTVKVLNLKDVCLWLIQSKYNELSFSETDKERWSSPIFFEKNKKGNCVDSSLWAWKKLSELGYPTRFFVGEKVVGDEIKHHAWVVLIVAGEDMLLETTSKDESKMIYYLHSAQSRYIPWASVDNCFNYKLHGGYCSAIKRNNNWSFN